MGTQTESGPEKSGECKTKISNNLDMVSKLKLKRYAGIYLYNINIYLAGFLITLALNVPFASNRFFFRTKKIYRN